MIKNIKFDKAWLEIDGGVIMDRSGKHLYAGKRILSMLIFCVFISGKTGFEKTTFQDCFQTIPIMQHAQNDYRIISWF